MTKLHAGSGLPHGHQNKGVAPKASPTHVGSGARKGFVHHAGAAKPPLGPHGGTSLPRVLKRK
jgi:hypothetical protein